MQFHPTRQELSEYSDKAKPDRLYYFLTRILESEEVWSLGSDAGWLIKETGETQVIPVWPYADLVHACNVDSLQGHAADAVSIEHFIGHLLPIMHEQGIGVEVFPTPREDGFILQANDLFHQIDGLRESGEYFLEG